MVTNGFSKLAGNTSEAQHNLYKDSRKKDCKASFYIQYVFDSENFDRITHGESTNEACDILVK